MFYGREDTACPHQVSIEDPEQKPISIKINLFQTRDDNTLFLEKVQNI